MKTERNRNKGIALVRAQTAAIAMRIIEAQGVVVSLGKQLTVLNQLEQEMVQAYARKPVRKPSAKALQAAGELSRTKTEDKVVTRVLVDDGREAINNT